MVLWLNSSSLYLFFPQNFIWGEIGGKETRTFKKYIIFNAVFKESAVL